MAKTREQKQKIIEDLKKNMAAKKMAVLVSFTKLNSKSLFKLRNELKKLNCLLKVIKKTLLKKTLEKIKEKNLLEKIGQIKGEIALIFSFEDEILPAKISYKFSKEHEALKILGGIAGSEFLEREKIIELAQLPSREELLARLAGAINYPVTSFVNVLKGNLRNFVFILKERSKI